jgi:hypothetical protein
MNGARNHFSSIRRHRCQRSIWCLPVSTRHLRSQLPYPFFVLCELWRVKSLTLVCAQGDMPSDADIKEAFMFFDKDGKDSLTNEEFIVMVQSLGT